jgi:BirA family transcriptional regulator, biotin operon repressor / biotin---[acetyl-CoA-carboxylase] ligase
MDDAPAAANTAADAVLGGEGGRQPVAPELPHRWEGLSGLDLAERLGVPRVAAYDAVASTMDVAHILAAQGAASGTIVLADRQTAGRGRGGRSWVSGTGGGVWMTLIERPVDAATIELWSVRYGVSIARALDPFTPEPVGIKWPNDLYGGSRKLAGILIEARWQDQRPLWVAIGIGINVRTPMEVATATGLRPGSSRLAVLEAVVPALRAAALIVGGLTPAEMEECRRRDIARGRRCREPAAGQVTGIGDRGELLVETADGPRVFRSGSLGLDIDAEGG